MEKLLLLLLLYGPLLIFVGLFAIVRLLRAVCSSLSAFSYPGALSYSFLRIIMVHHRCLYTLL